MKQQQSFILLWLALGVDAAIVLALIGAYLIPDGFMLSLLAIPLFIAGIVLGALLIGKKSVPLAYRVLALLGPFIPMIAAMGIFLILENGA
ncbi:MAG: hypothetical protein KDK34_18285 [Leptospiraceae bacterium]|nr:hypothetical protein [Leptospiraceae bacterium]